MCCTKCPEQKPTISCIHRKQPIVCVIYYSILYCFPISIRNRLPSLSTWRSRTTEAMSRRTRTYPLINGQGAVQKWDIQASTANLRYQVLQHTNSSTVTVAYVVLQGIHLQKALRCSELISQTNQKPESQNSYPCQQISLNQSQCPRWDQVCFPTDF